MYDLVSAVLNQFVDDGFELHRKQYLIFWGKGETQRPHIDGHYTTPDRAGRQQVDDALSVLLYLSNREVSL